MKEIIFNNETEGFIKIVQNSSWFTSCGNPYSEKLEYDYILDDNIESVRKHITRGNNYAGIVITENLFEQANLRLYNFLKHNGEINVLQHDDIWGRLRETAIPRLKEFIDFNGINEVFCRKFELGLKKGAAVTDNVCLLLGSTIREMYYKSLINGIPLFYEKIIKIYLDGHLITGWKGKLPLLTSQSIEPDKPIDRKKGTIIIW
ncbi:MAG: hypothetical protein LBD13_07765 [Spirochaetaceae bacterium]|jgi:hypothetical protein|nr:hypothetical protein [Spirochaetaceae bacterium]